MTVEDHVTRRMNNAWEDFQVNYGPASKNQFYSIDQYDLIKGTFLAGYAAAMFVVRDELGITSGNDGDDDAA